MSVKRRSQPVGVQVKLHIVIVAQGFMELVFVRIKKIVFIPLVEPVCTQYIGKQGNTDTRLFCDVQHLVGRVKQGFPGRSS